MLVVTVLKTCFSKKKPRELEYRNYKNFNSVIFNEDLKYMFSQDPVNSCDKFDKVFLEVLDKHAPRKKKILRANHSSYVSKALRKAIMKRSYLEKLYFKNRTENSLKTYKRQKNYCSRLYKKERKEFFNNLNPSFVKDNKIFWKTIKPFFSDKGNLRSQIKLIENDELIQNDNKVAETLNTFFKNAVSTVGDQL